MLLHRPQTVFLEEVVRWPQLLRRSVASVHDLLRHGGYALGRVSVRLTPDGVHAVYAARV
jgi:hypothetical protein